MEKTRSVKEEVEGEVFISRQYLCHSILMKQASSATKLHKTLAQKLAMTRWQEFRKRVSVTMTRWQEFNKRFAIVFTWWQELKKTFPVAPLDFPQEIKGRRVLQVTHHFAVRIPLRNVKQTRFCWLFSSWRATAIAPTSTTTLTKFQNCLNPSRQQCPPAT